MRPDADYVTAAVLVARGLNDCEIARTTGIPRSTLRDWRNGRVRQNRTAGGSSCPTCGHPSHNFDALPPGPYAYLLGLYLGDGCLDQQPRTWRLRVSLDVAYPGIVDGCRLAMRTCLPRNRVLVYRPDRESNHVVVVTHSKQLICLFPQHGPGMKHLRRIELEDWQQRIVEYQSDHFIRGLIHSDGSRVINRIRHNGRVYEYPRYFFTNASEDIRGLFTDALTRLHVRWRRTNERTISVADRRSVELLDTFIGPKK